MTYNGVGRVVPSMVTPSTSASSQNAACRGEVGAVRLGGDGRVTPTRPVRPGACVVVMSVSFRFCGCGGTSLTADRVIPRHTAG